MQFLKKFPNLNQNINQNIIKDEIQYGLQNHGLQNVENGNGNGNQNGNQNVGLQNVENGNGNQNGNQNVVLQNNENGNGLQNVVNELGNGKKEEHRNETVEEIRKEVQEIMKKKHENDMLLENKLAQMMKIFKDNDTLEMEVRVGKINSDLSFRAGYTHDCRCVISRLLSRLMENVKKYEYENERNKRWTMEKQFVYLKSYYKYNGTTVIGINIPNQTEKYYIKRKNVVIDVQTTRPMDLRFSLNEEIPIILNRENDEKLFDLITRGHPNYVSMITRTSFFEHIEILGARLVFRYDISKVSDPSKTKMESSKKPCTYHCEIEIMNPVPKSTNLEHESQINSIIIDMFIKRACVLLGTHVKSKNESKKLELPKLVVINNKEIQT